jgi:hypothetical protein
MPDPTSDQPLSLVKQESRAIQHASPSPLDMLQSMIEKGVTTENAAAFEQLVKLSEHMEDRKAEREFAQAFNALQSEMKAVKAMKPVPNNDGSTRYKFAPYEEIMKQVGPLLERHNFTVSFSTKFEEARLIKICTLQHIGGHSRSNEFAVRVGKGPPGSSDAQADGAASTYAKRFALCDILNIQIETDSDARIEGTTISADQAMELRDRLRTVSGDEKAFLKFAGASTFEAISSANVAMLEEFLAKKERLYMQRMEGKK